MAGNISGAQLRARVARGRIAVELGRAAEDIAARFLISQGLEVVLRNFRRRLGEIDLVARDKGVLVVAEVRTRSSNRYGGAAASIDARKQRRIILATLLMLRRYKQYARMRVRFDALVVSDVLSEKPQVQWIRQAFLAI